MKKDKQIETFRNFWKDEKEAAMLYALMATREKDHKKREIYEKLSQIETGHAEVWEKELTKLGFDPRKFKPRFKARVLNFLGKLLGHKSLLEILERGEDGAVRGYATTMLEVDDSALQENIKHMLMDEKSHSTALAELGGKSVDPLEGERWHSGKGQIRDIIFGMNDGLLSTFSLVTGVAGAAVANAIILLAGVAGAIAGAISMAAGAYVSTKTEKEVLEKELESEQLEVETMPELEKEELALLYELKGIEREKAREMAEAAFTHNGAAFDTIVREELGIAPEETGNPLKAGMSSGVFFTIGAIVPVFPYAIQEIAPYLLFGISPVYISIITSLGSFFIVGAFRTLVTGKNPWKSGAEMFLIGFFAAIVTYMIGSMIPVPTD